MRIAYSVLLLLALPLIFLGLAMRALREPAYWRGWHQRLGWGRIHARGGLWVHAASVGEVAAAAPLVRALRLRYPNLPVLVTTFTPTGRARARAAFAEDAEVRLLPLDLAGATRRFMRKAAPSCGIFLETELWPNLIEAAARQGVPLLLANARLSPTSSRRYARWPLRALFGRALGQFTVVAAAGPQEAERLLAAGVARERLVETGNLKFDLQLPADLRDAGAALRASWGESRPVWIAASTHQGEEDIVLDAFAKLRARYPDCLLVLVPRHPQRFQRVADLLHARGLAMARYSRADPVEAVTQVLLGDTLGDLLLFYAAADLAFVGGSLVPRVGGHNLLEPAALRLPIIVGEKLGSWAPVADWLQDAGALCRVADANALKTAVIECLEDDHGRKMAGLAAARVVEEQGGALERTLRLIPPLLTPGL